MYDNLDMNYVYWVFVKLCEYISWWKANGNVPVNSINGKIPKVTIMDIFLHDNHCMTTKTCSGCHALLNVIKLHLKLQTHFGHANRASIELRDSLIGLVSSLPHSIVLKSRKDIKQTFNTRNTHLQWYNRTRDLIYKTLCRSHTKGVRATNKTKMAHAKKWDLWKRTCARTPASNTYIINRALPGIVCM